MRYSHMTMKHTLDRAIHSIRTGVPIGREDRVNCADVLSGIRDWIASVERREADKGSDTARGLREVMTEEINRIR